VLDSPALATSLVEAGLAAAEQFAWPRVREAWLEIYAKLAAKPLHPRPATASE
jgi:hypothetical protein